jgi:hypothetical protein
MPKHILGAAVIAALISGCAQNTLIDDELSSHSYNLSTDIYGELLYKDGDYYLSDKLYLDSSRALVENEKTASFKFHVQTFRPAFRTSRSECKKSLSTNGCEAYEEKEHLFQYVNFLKSGYGDTLAERREAEQEEGMKAGEVALHVVASPVYVAGAAGALAAVAFMSPFLAIGAALNPEKTSTRTNYVEFHHDDFDDAVKDAITDSKYGSLGAYISVARDVVSIDEDIKRLNRTLEIESKTKRNALHEGIKKYYNSGSRPPLVSISKPEFLRVYSTEKELNQTSKYSQLETIKAHYAQENQRVVGEYASVEIEAKENYKIEQKANFVSLANSKATRNFLTTYERLDLVGLIPEAKSKLNVQLKAEEKERVRQAKLAEERRIVDEKEKHRQDILAEQKIIAEAKDLKSWRISLKIGSDTFCGPVIDINEVMVKIAVRVQLSGYASEAWLKRGELYPPSMGCQNRNGILSPYS